MWLSMLIRHTKYCSSEVEELHYTTLLLHRFCHRLSFSSVKVSFEPTNSIAVTDGINRFAELILVRSRYTNRTATVTVTTLAMKANGMPAYIYLQVLDYLIHIGSVYK